MGHCYCGLNCAPNVLLPNVLLKVLFVAVFLAPARAFVGR
jgi:hypothetical protein